MMVDNMRRAYTIVSLSARHVTEEYLRYCIAAASARGHSLTVFFLDHYEYVNAALFCGTSEGESREVTRRLKAKAVDILPPDVTVVETSTLSHTCEFQRFEELVLRVYRQDRHARNCANNETFRNLDHRLKQIGVRNARDKRIQDIVIYLLHELALYAWIATSEKYVLEIAPRPRAVELMRRFFSKEITHAIEQIEHVIVPPGCDNIAAELDGVGYAVPSGKAIVSGVSAKFRRNTVTGLVGPNGSGKSTLLRLIAGHLAVNIGRIIINQNDVTRAAPRKRGVSTVFQQPRLLPGHSVKRNMELFAASSGRQKAFMDRLVDQVIVALDVDEDVLERRGDNLSGGETQKAAIARSLVSGATILLMDEPGSALDAATRVDVLRKACALIRNSKGGDFPATAIVVAHDPDLISAVSDDVLVIDEGKLITTGPLPELLRNPESRTAAHHLCHANTFEVKLVNGTVRVDGGLVQMSWREAQAITGAMLLNGHKAGGAAVCLYVPLWALAFSESYYGEAQKQTVNVTRVARRALGFEVFLDRGTDGQPSILVSHLGTWSALAGPAQLTIDMSQCAFVRK